MATVAAPAQSQRLSGRAAIRGALLFWHLCSLDAPTIAVLWCATLGKVAGVPVRAEQLGLLALGAWIVYVLDRLLDALPQRGNGEAGKLRDRHRFHRKHRRVLLIGAGAAAVVLALLAAHLPFPLVRTYLLLALPVATGSPLQPPRWPALHARPLAAPCKQARITPYTEEPPEAPPASLACFLPCCCLLCWSAATLKGSRAVHAGSESLQIWRCLLRCSCCRWSAAVEPCRPWRRASP